MDDLLVFYAGLDEEKFLRDISGECYLPPLKLEDGGEATFLETSFKITGPRPRYAGRWAGGPARGRTGLGLGVGRRPGL